MPNRRAFVTLAACVAAAITAPAFALGSLVDVELVARAANETLPVWPHRGESWVAGRQGERYAVRLSNRSGARVLVVLSIDGVNAISGETASTGQTGYVFGAWDASDIAGWRKSDSQIAAFEFTAPGDSYAARTDRPDNVGVIGAAVFREKAREPELVLRAAPSADAPARESKAAGAARDERLGTGHGEREYAPTTQTTFDRAGERPNEVVRIRYDSAERLVALGVIRPRRAPPVTPDPFPSRFVPDPNG